MRINKVSDRHIAGRSAGTLSVHIGDDVRRTADVVVADNTATESHTTVRRRRHEDH